MSDMCLSRIELSRESCAKWIAKWLGDMRVKNKWEIEVKLIKNSLQFKRLNNVCFTLKVDFVNFTSTRGNVDGVDSIFQQILQHIASQ